MRLINIFLVIVYLSCNSRNPQKKQFEIPDNGFEFVNDINQNDSTFPFYPVRSKISNFDSTYDAFNIRKLLEAFNEPNISLRPSPYPIIRLIYNPWTDSACIITITPTSILAKFGDRVDYLHYDEKNLSEKELLHFDLFKYGFPISKRLMKASPQQKRNLDSLLTLYPELENQEYYHYILNKAFTPLIKPYTYTTKEIRLTESDFQNIINKLNKAGFWTLNMEEYCEPVANDGVKYFIEFCSEKKYVFISFLSGCTTDNIINLKIAIREILTKYNLNKKFKIW